MSAGDECVFLQLLNSVRFIPLKKRLTLPSTTKKKTIRLFQNTHTRTHTHSVSLHTSVVFYCQTNSNISILLSLSLSLSLCRPFLPHRSKTLVYATHEATSLLNIYFSFLSEKKISAPLCVCVCPAMCFFSAGTWL